ncbi:hypothetical protein NKH77_44845 [Streptomyces sp. M19]
MKAIIYRDNGAPTFAVRRPRPARARPRRGSRPVAVSGVNPTDWQARSGVGHPSTSPRSPRTSTAPARSTPSVRASTRAGSVSGSGCSWPPPGGPPAPPPSSPSCPPNRPCRCPTRPTSTSAPHSASRADRASRAHRRRGRPASAAARALDGKVVLAAGGPERSGTR